MFSALRLIADTTRTSRHVRFVPNFSRKSPFLLRRLSYMKDLPPERADNPRSELAAWMAAAVSYSKIAI